jgi:CheY-like chemotaxis protein
MSIPSPRRPQDPARVLVVEDDDVVGGFIQSILEMSGYEVFRALDGEQAIVMAHDLNPDLVTLDVMMPGIDGWEVAHQLRLDEVTADTRIVMVSAIPPNELSDRARQEPVQAVLSKPFDFAALVEVVEQALAFAA